jgi:hypothetical protein
MTFVCHLGGSDRAAEKGTFFFFHGWGRFKACRRFDAYRRFNAYRQFNVQCSKVQRPARHQDV